MIGIVGGMGPYAGLDLVKKVFDLTQADQDQEHVPLAMISVPHKIEDRTKFLERQTVTNPGIEISKIVTKLSNQGASIIGMPCNTAHASDIIKEVNNRIPKGVMFINMIEEVIKFIQKKYPNKSKVGVLATAGTIKSNVYNNELMKNNLQPIVLSKKKQGKLVDESIYNKDFGIKSISNPVHENVIKNIELAIESLIDKKADVIILGCTELPLAINTKSYNSVPLIDSTLVLAISLLTHSNPDSLKK
jgi:aspartate racemase